MGIFGLFFFLHPFTTIMQRNFGWMGPKLQMSGISSDHFAAILAQQLLKA